MNIKQIMKQSTEGTNRRVKRLVLVPLSIVLVLVAGYASAGPHFGGHGMSGHGKHGISHPLQRMLDHVDLSDQQEAQIADIFSKLKDGKAKRHAFSMMKAMMAISPEDENYNEQVSRQAELASLKVKQKIVELAEMRKEIYSILSDEQKQELDELLERKVRRLEKRMSLRD